MSNPNQNWKDAIPSQYFLRGPKKEDKPWIPKLPPLGQTILRHLIEHYGAPCVAKAAQVFVEASERQELIEQSKKELDAMLLETKKITIPEEK